MVFEYIMNSPQRTFWAAKNALTALFPLGIPENINWMLVDTWQNTLENTTPDKFSVMYLQYIEYYSFGCSIS